MSDRITIHLTGHPEDQLLERTLGTKPFVLIELDTEESSDGMAGLNLSIDLTCGGNANVAGVAGILEVVVETLRNADNPELRD